MNSIVCSSTAVRSDETFTNFIIGLSASTQQDGCLEQNFPPIIVIIFKKNNDS